MHGFVNKYFCSSGMIFALTEIKQNQKFKISRQLLLVTCPFSVAFVTTTEIVHCPCRIRLSGREKNED